MARNEIKSWMKKKGFTIDSLSKELKFSYSTVAKWVHGTNPHDIYKDSIKEKFPDFPIEDN